jgi:protein gp37
MAKRLQAMGIPAYANGFKPTVHPEKFSECLSWKKPRLVFVNSMSDTFHEDFSDDAILYLFAVMNSNPKHTFQVLTKRAQRLSNLAPRINWTPNIWMGVTVEDQQRADERIPFLLQVPAAVRFVSVEPMLGPVNLERILWHSSMKHRVDVLRGGYWNKKGCLGLGPSANLDEDKGGFTNHSDFPSTVNWVICGGESGPNARPMHPDWVRPLRDQCIEAEVPFFFKQWGEWILRDTKKHNKTHRIIRDTNTYCNGSDNSEAWMHRVGKKSAGRILDGKEWSQMPL